MKDATQPADDTHQPLVSVITAVYNNVEHVASALEAVAAQDYPRIEHVVIDGGSTDGTLDVIARFKDHLAVVVSEPDSGLYDALNKGIANANGKYIAFLHSDDLFQDDQVISSMVTLMVAEDAEFCCSDVVIVDQESDKVLRYYMAGYFRRWLFRTGWMPPHPGCMFSRALHDEFGLYSTQFRIAGDFDFMVRMFYGRDIRWTYLNQVTMRMRGGGLSNAGFASKRLIVEEVQRALRQNGIWSPSVFQLARYVIRGAELFLRPKDPRSGR